MVSLCIKTTKNDVADFLMQSLDSVDLDDVVFVQKEFSKYINVIVHYLGNNIPVFYNVIAELLTDCIIANYESSIVYNLLVLNYFYFSNDDINTIKHICCDTLKDDTPLNNSCTMNELLDRKVLLSNDVLKYVSYNKSLVLDGFVNFRIRDYIDCLDNIVDFSVSQFIINREYAEFIDLLRMYIDSRETEAEIVHLIYLSGESILLDKNKNVISLSKESMDSRYLSDISFSSNDYALNSLLALLPRRIIIHLIGPSDDFIDTIKLIFENRVSVCEDCNICQTYKIMQAKNSSK